MVTTLAPSRAPMGTEQDRMGASLICTVQAPHCAIPQPNFVPVKPITSRKTQRSGVSGSMSMCRDTPLTSIVITMAFHRFEITRYNLASETWLSRADFGAELLLTPMPAAFAAFSHPHHGVPARNLGSPRIHNSLVPKMERGTFPRDSSARAPIPILAQAAAVRGSVVIPSSGIRRGAPHASRMSDSRQL